MDSAQKKTEAEEIALLISLGQKYLWKGAETKAKLEANGVELIQSGFYSPVPTVEDIESSWELRDGAMPYLDSNLYDNVFMVEFLNRELLPFAADFNPPMNSTHNPNVFCWLNDKFSYCDAMAYYCMIRYLKPHRIIEIGAGHSSRIANQALKDNGGGEFDPS